MDVGKYFGIILIIIGIILIIFGIKLLKRWSRPDSTYNSFKPILCFDTLFVGLIVIGCGAAYKPYDPQKAAYSTNSDSQVKCQVCGRSFSNTSSDAKSIRKTNMCSQCYKNYNAAQGMLDN